MRVRTQYNQWCEWYDDVFLDSYNYIAPRNTFNRVAEYTDVSHPTLRFLDVGIGTGLLAEEFGRVNPDAFIAGIDFSEGMLEKCREKGIADILLQGSITAPLPFDDNIFDITASTGVLELITRPADVIGEMSRVLKPGGIIAFTNPVNWLDRPHTVNNIFSSITGFFNWVERGRSHREAYMYSAMQRNGIELLDTTFFAGYRKNGAHTPYQLYVGRKLG